MKTLKNLAIVFMVMLFFIAASNNEYRPFSTSIVTKSFNTSYQLSTYRNYVVSYSVQISSTLSLTSGQSGTVTLYMSADGTNWTSVASAATNNNTGTLTLGLNTVQTQASTLIAFVPAGYYIKMVTSGTSTFTYISGQETQL